VTATLCSPFSRRASMWRSGWSILESFVPRPSALAVHETRSLCGGGRHYGSLWNPHSLLSRGFVCLLLALFPCAFSSVAWEPYLGSSHQQSVSSFPLPLKCASYVEARWFSSVRSGHVSSLVTCFLLRLSGVFLLVDLPKVAKGLEFASGFSWDLMMVFRLDQCLDPQVCNLYLFSCQPFSPSTSNSIGDSELCSILPCTFWSLVEMGFWCCGATVAVSLMGLW
jgi:hypothetical protein